MATPYVSRWAKGATGAKFSRQAFLDMLDGRVPFVRQPKFVSREVAKKFEDHIVPQMAPYLHATGPALRKLGVAQFEFQAQSGADLINRSADAQERYFGEAEKHRSMHTELEKTLGRNLWQEIYDLIRTAVPEWDVVVASEGPSKRYFSGIFRCINESTPIHCDWSPYDSRTEEWLVKNVTQQGVFNLYLSPFKGGRTEIHDIQWTPEALQYRDPDTYGYAPELVSGRQRATIHPEVGDLCMFNSRNLHQVFPVETPDAEGETEAASEAAPWANGKQPRLTLSSFFGLLPATGSARPKLVLWS